MDKKNSKLLAHDFGLFAEEMAAREYVKNGYAILERNWRLGKTEIDIIAQKGDTVVLIEVKGRCDDNSDPLVTVTRDKRKRMVKAADYYLSRLKGNINYRFDIFTLNGNMENYNMEIIEEAFLATDLF